MAKSSSISGASLVVDSEMMVVSDSYPSGCTAQARPTWVRRLGSVGEDSAVCVQCESFFAIYGQSWLLEAFRAKILVEK